MRWPGSSTCRGAGRRQASGRLPFNGPMSAPRNARLKGMRWIAPGSFRMGAEDFYPEEAPVHRVELDGFWIDEHPVTVAAFRRFTNETGYVTTAERAPDPRDYPG